MFGFSDVDSDSDVSTSNNYSHLTHGIYITRKQVSSVFYNTFEVRENGGNGIGNSDWYAVNGLTPAATNGPWDSGEDTFYRFTIQLKKGGGAIYKAFKNGVNAINKHNTNMNPCKIYCNHDNLFIFFFVFLLT